MKNASCHDEKMEAYCKTVRALEDKVYDIEINNFPRKDNEEADELAKIASGRITFPPNVFARDVVKPSVDLGSPSSNQEEPSGAPSNPAGAKPINEDLRTRRPCSPCSRAMEWMKLRPWRQSPPRLRAEDWRAKYLA
jgi:hypothetical protein